MRHPSMAPKDAIKLCFQAAFGAEHILSDYVKALEFLHKEYSETNVMDMDVFEPISDEYVRINIAAWKYKGLPVEWLFEMFYQTAEKSRKNSSSLFMEYLEIVSTQAEEGILPFDNSMWLSFKNQYLSTGIKPLHHSNKYRDLEHPTYRVVSKKFVTILPILEKAITFPAGDMPKIIAIDGRAASGKTTVAELLSTALKADTIHMDDFFLPPELRIPERHTQSGGNIHYERFCSEGLPFLKKSKAFSYRCFDCSIMDFGSSCMIKSDTWRIVEGSYSHHPIFGDYADLFVFCDVSKKEQMQRIIKRNGNTLAERFAKEWIPMEEQYFDTEKIKENADIIIE